MANIEHSAQVTPEQAGRRFDQILAEILVEYSRGRIQAWIKAGAAQLDGKVVQPKTRVKAGQQIDVRVELVVDETPVAEQMPLEVVYEDPEVIVVNKPAGLVVHPGAGNPSHTLMNGLLHYAPELAVLPRAGIVHRLDKDTTGLLIIARTLPAHATLVAALEQREIQREYRALCHGVLVAGGTIDAPIGRDVSHRTRMRVTEKGKTAITDYRVLHRFAAHSLIGVRLATGRTHQIRVHMAHQQHSLVGDPVYGGRIRVPAGLPDSARTILQNFRRQALHASHLEFRHPASRELISISAPLPRDLLDLLLALDDGAQIDFNSLSWPQA